MACFVAQFHFTERKPVVASFSVTPRAIKVLTFPVATPSTINLKVTSNDNCNLELQYMGPVKDPAESYEKFVVVEDEPFITQVNRPFFVKPSEN